VRRERRLASLLVAGEERKESQSLDVEVSRFRSARGVLLRSTLGELGAHKDTAAGGCQARSMTAIKGSSVALPALWA
jgi:hypothetical protein